MPNDYLVVMAYTYELLRWKLKYNHYFKFALYFIDYLFQTLIKFNPISTLRRPDRVRLTRKSRTS